MREDYSPDGTAWAYLDNDQATAGERAAFPGDAGGAHLKGFADLPGNRLVNLYRRDPQRGAPALRCDSPLQYDPHWRGLYLFYEYFHGENGQGLGAAHQTGWTGLLANLVMRRYRKDIPLFWRKMDECSAGKAAAAD